MLDLGAMRGAVVSHPDDMKQVFTDPRFREKGPMYDGVRRIIGDGILTSAGDKWRDNHRLVSPHFYRGQVAGMVDAIADVGSAYARDLRERAQSGVEVDVLEEMTGLTIRTLGAVTLGRNAARVDELTYNDLQAAFELAGRAGGPMDAETRARQRQLTGQLKGFADTLIDTARKAEPPDGSLLSVLAHTRIEATGACLDTPSIRDEVLTIMFAGHETTALTLTWMFKLIQNHPDIRAQMQQEIQNVLQGRTPALDDLPKLVTVRNVINETLRQRPAVPITARAVGEKAVIGGIALEPGDAVLPFIWGTHHHSGFWKRPDGFEPSRFSPERSAGRNKWSFIPFTAGSRICVGQELARTELTVHTALLMQAVDMQVADEVVTPRATLTLRPDVPVRAHVRARALGPSTGASQ